MNKKFTSRILSMLLAVLMLISMMPTSVFAAPASDIPAEMLDNVFLDALEYTGYKVQAQRDDGTIFKKYSGGATAYLSKISYGLNKYGTETVAKSGTATGLAPDIAGFESSGLCCASFVSYVYYNYLPNIAGIDTSSATRPYNLRTATAYNAAANAWVNAGTARRISFSQNANGNNFIPSEDIPIGSLIIFKHIPTGDIAHVAVYAGYYNGTHFVFHVGNDRGPEISSIVGMSKGDYPEAVVQVVAPEFVEAAGKIEVYKKDPKGAALSGAYFIATNTSTGTEYAIGPTDSRGYACTKERLPFGTYRIVETVFPTDYTYSGTKEWTRTVSASNNGVVTIQAVNELKKGNIEVYKKSSGTNEALKGAIFTVYDMSGAKVTAIGPTNDRGYAKSADIPYGSYRVVETTFPFNYEPDGQTEWKVTIDTAHGSLATVNAYNRLKKGHIEVLKSDAESGKDLSGAEFTVYDLAGEEIAVIGPTDKNGYAKSGEIIYGDYIVKETKVPVNYQPDGDAQWKVTIDDNSPLITLDIANLRQYGMVKVCKTAEDGLVEGLTFHLTGTSEYGESVDMTAVTNAVGTAVFERVPIGTDYTLSEENTPERYVIPEVQNISVEWNKVTERQFDNILKKWRADVLKVDASLRSNGGHENPQMLSLDSDSIVENLGYPYGETQGDATLAGAVYGVYRYDELVDTYVTDKNGYFLTDYYPCGEGWNIREITPSEGYLLDETVYWLGVTPGQYTLEKNTKELDVYEDIIFGSLYLIKHMDDGSTGLETVEAGAEFEVFLKTAGSYENARDTERDYLITDEHGYAGTKQLPYGVYTVRQMKGTEGFDLAAPFDVFIDKDGCCYQYLLNNAPFTGYLKIQKTDAESGLSIPYAGAAFQIYNPDGTRVTMQYTYPELTVIDTFYTNEEGYLITPEVLPFGKGYSIVEVKAPYGYVLNSDPVYFDVTADSATEDGGITLIEVTRSNMPQKGIVRITKTGEVFWTVTEAVGIYKPVYAVKSLPGAVFEIRAAEDICTLDGVMHYAKGEIVDAITTGSDGVASSKELYLGKYVVKETKQPIGFIRPNQTWDVELKYADQKTELVKENLTIKNQPTEIIIDKKETGTDKPLEGVKFVIWNKDKEDPIDPGMQHKEIYTTDKNGKIRLLYLEPGNYAVAEVESIPGYAWDDKMIYEFTITEDGRVDGEVSHTIPVGNDRTEITETNAINVSTGTQDAYAVDLTVIDTVSMVNLMPNREYKLQLILADAKTGEPLKVKDQPSGDLLTTEKTFTADSSKMDVDMQIEFDASPFAGRTIVVYEYLYQDGVEISRHEDLNDKKQQIYVKDKLKLNTTAIDLISGTHEAIAKKDVTIRDNVDHFGLIKGQEYVLKGILMDQTTGKPLVINGKQITAEKSVQIETADGTVPIDFTLDASELNNRSIVVYEYLYHNGQLIASHEDITDEDQTITFKVGSLKPILPPNKGGGLLSALKTGDFSDIMPFAIALIGTGAIILSIVIYNHRKKKKREE